MKIKFFLSLIAFVLLGSLTFSQVSVVNAVSNSLQTNPITGPITSAVHILKGRVGIRIGKFIFPAIGVSVNATNTSSASASVVTTRINSQGEYSFNLKEGSYNVSIKDLPHVDFLINEKFVQLNQDRANIDFLGVLR